MILPDQVASDALSADYIKPVFFAWLDFNGAAVRCNTSGRNITPSGTGDPDLDGFEFTGINGTFVSVDPVRFRSGGSDSVTAKVSGIPGLDDETLALIGDTANWRSRDARLWRVIYTNAGQQGGYHAYYTGKMTHLSHNGDEEGQQIAVTIEDYLSFYSAPSNRTYMSQEEFDPGDLSARAATAIANGNYTGSLVPAPEFAGFGDYGNINFGGYY